jgi:hypothetical protein
VSRSQNSRQEETTPILPLRELRALPNDAAEFALAAVVAFAVFYLSIDRAISPWRRSRPRARHSAGPCGGR